MKIAFVKTQCCHDAGRVVADIDETDQKKLAEWLIATCMFDMGDDCSVTVWHTLAEAEQCYGEELPEELVEAFEKAEGGVLESTNGCPPEFLPLPAVATGAYYSAIINDLIGCDWGDCTIHIDE